MPRKESIPPEPWEQPNSPTSFAADLLAEEARAALHEEPVDLEGADHRLPGQADVPPTDEISVEGAGGKECDDEAEEEDEIAYPQPLLQVVVEKNHVSEAKSPTPVAPLDEMPSLGSNGLPAPEQPRTDVEAAASTAAALLGGVVQPITNREITLPPHEAEWRGVVSLRNPQCLHDPCKKNLDLKVQVLGTPECFRVNALTKYKLETSRELEEQREREKKKMDALIAAKRSAIQLVKQYTVKNRADTALKREASVQLNPLSSPENKVAASMSAAPWRKLKVLTVNPLAKRDNSQVQWDSVLNKLGEENDLSMLTEVVSQRQVVEDDSDEDRPNENELKKIAMEAKAKEEARKEVEAKYNLADVAKRHGFDIPKTDLAAQEGVDYTHQAAWLQEAQSEISDNAVRKRVEAKMNPKFGKEVSKWWDLLTTTDKILRKEYVRAHMKIFDILISSAGGAPNKNDSYTSAMEDFSADSEGREGVSYPKFYASMFELADNWTSSLEPAEYVRFLKTLRDRLQDDDNDSGNQRPAGFGITTPRPYVYYFGDYAPCGHGTKPAAADYSPKYTASKPKSTAAVFNISRRVMSSEDELKITRDNPGPGEYNIKPLDRGTSVTFTNMPGHSTDFTSLPDGFTTAMMCMNGHTPVTMEPLTEEFRVANKMTGWFRAKNVPGSHYKPDIAPGKVRWTDTIPKNLHGHLKSNFDVEEEVEFDSKSMEVSTRRHLYGGVHTKIEKPNVEVPDSLRATDTLTKVSYNNLKGMRAAERFALTTEAGARILKKFGIDTVEAKNDSHQPMKAKMIAEQRMKERPQSALKKRASRPLGSSRQRPMSALATTTRARVSIDDPIQCTKRPPSANLRLRSESTVQFDVKVDEGSGDESGGPDIDVLSITDSNPGDSYWGIDVDDEGSNWGDGDDENAVPDMNDFVEYVSTGSGAKTKSKRAQSAGPKPRSRIPFSATASVFNGVSARPGSAKTKRRPLSAHHAVQKSRTDDEIEDVPQYTKLRISQFSNDLNTRPASACAATKQPSSRRSSGLPTSSRTRRTEISSFRSAHPSEGFTDTTDSTDSTYNNMYDTLIRPGSAPPDVLHTKFKPMNGRESAKYALARPIRGISWRSKNLCDEQVLEKTILSRFTNKWSGPTEAHMYWSSAMEDDRLRASTTLA